MSTKIIHSKFFFEEDYEDGIASVPVKRGEPLSKKKKLKYVGKPVTRIDAGKKVTGQAQYAFDVWFPDMLHARILRSPHANAKITKIDISQALNSPGVKEIITHQNSPQIPWYRGSSYLFDPHPRYAGDEVACVLAESDLQAIEALDKIAVEYKVLPHITDPVEVMKENEQSERRGKPRKYKRGNFDTAFTAAPYKAELTFSTPVAIHNPLEVHCSVAKWKNDKLTVWDSTQAVFRVRDAIAEALSLDPNDVRIIKQYMGGGFGSKLEAGKYSVMAAILAKRSGHPVRIVLDREEMNLAVGNRPDSFQRLKGAANREGELLALSHFAYGSSGAYPANAGCGWPLLTLYKCDHVALEEYSVHTNTGRARPFRAPGHVQGTFGLESLVDDLAEKVGMDPLEFRILNETSKDQVSGLPYTSKKLLQAYREGAEKIGWKDRPKKPGQSGGRIKTGIGMASQIWWGGGGPPAYAEIKLQKSGRIEVRSGTQDLGTGTYTIIAQTAAEILDIPLDKFDIVIGDTGTTPYAPGSGGSVTAASVTPAIKDASENLRVKIMETAAAFWNTTTKSLQYKEGVVSEKGNPDKRISINDLVLETREKEIKASGSRNENPKNYAINTFGAHFAKVDVDTETGKIRVRKIVAAHDVGRIINKKTAENQFHGGIIQGLGFALFEERIMDHEAGSMTNPNLLDYKIPTFFETPEIEVLIVSDYDNKVSPMGVKGIGEPAIIPTAAAIANAVYNAIGVRIQHLPMTSDTVLTALTSGRRP